MGKEGGVEIQSRTSLFNHCIFATSVQYTNAVDFDFLPLISQRVRDVLMYTSAASLKFSPPAPQIVLPKTSPKHVLM